MGLTVRDRLRLLLHYLLPKLWLTRMAGWCAAKRMGGLTQLMIKLFIRVYNVQMHEAQNPQPASYNTFNDFFTRPLHDDARPINNDDNVLIMPADGIISQLGRIEQDKLIQAKGHNYSLLALLAGNHTLAEQVQHGEYVTIYLSPRDYHRVHMPCDAVLREMIYVPGELYSVSLFTAQHIPNLFARNERVICCFDTKFGTLIQIMVGATIVGSIETVWMGNVTPPRDGVIKNWRWPQTDGQAVELRKGQQMGRFKLGSTVITLFAQGSVALLPDLQNSSVRMGQALAQAGNSPLSDQPARM